MARTFPFYGIWIYYCKWPNISETVVYHYEINKKFFTFLLGVWGLPEYLWTSWMCRGSMPGTTHRPLYHRGPSVRQFSPQSPHGGFVLSASSIEGGRDWPCSSNPRTSYERIGHAWGSRRRPHPLLAPPQAPVVKLELIRNYDVIVM